MGCALVCSSVERTWLAFPFLQLLNGDANPSGQGVRINSTKYLRVNQFDKPKYDIVVNDAPVSFHFDKVWFFQKVRLCVFPADLLLLSFTS